MATLERRIGTQRAVFIGLSSMIGAGVFFVWAPAAEVAGNALLIGLAIAAVIATLNALSTTQLAMAYPVSGGSYAYGRAVIGERTGFAAGALFLAGKTASVAAIALIAGTYLWPGSEQLLAVAILIVFAAINLTGIRSTATVSVVVVVVVLTGLALALGVAVGGGDLQPLTLDLDSSWYGILQSAGLLFFCFAGYARMATLGEEVVNPRRTLPRAILIALAITLAVYAAVAVVCLSVLGADQLAETASPIAAIVGGGADAFVRAIAGIACLGSLIGILAGLSRTTMAMAREGDLPAPLARIYERTHSPAIAEIAVAIVAIVAVLFLEPSRLVGFSSCAVLGYYAIAHASALRQSADARWLPRWVQVLGLGGCLLIALMLPWPAIAATAAVLLLALGVREFAMRTVRG